MAENVVVTINVTDLGTRKVKEFAKGIKTELATVGGSVKTVNGVFTNFTSTLAKNTFNAFAVLPAYAAVGAVIGGLGAIVATAIKDFIAFDKNLREASSIAPELVKNFEKARQAIINLDPALGKTADIAAGLFETLSAGISIGRSIGESITFTADAAKLARAALTDQATAVKALSTALSAFGGDIKSASAFADIFQKTVVIGQFRFEDLVSTLGRVSPVAATLGISFAEMNAAIATLSQGGLSASESVTALRAALNSVIKNADKFRAAGIDVNTILSEENGLVKLFTRLREVTGGSSEAIVKFVPNIRGLIAALALTGPQFEALIRNNEIVKNSLGETSRAFQENQKSISAALDRLGASFDRAVQGRFGTQLAENVSDSLDILGGAITETGDKAGILEVALEKTGGTLSLIRATAFGYAGSLGTVITQSVKAAEAISRTSVVTGIATGALDKLGDTVQEVSNDLFFAAKGNIALGVSLLKGTLAAQEALNRQEAATNNLVFAQQQANREAKAQIDILGAIEKGSNLAATSMGGFGSATAGAAGDLKGLGIAGVDAATAQEQLRDQLVGVIKATDNFDNRLAALSGGIVKNLNLTNEAAKNTRALALEFTQAVASIIPVRDQLAKLGATTDQLAGRTKFTADAMADLAEKSGQSVLDIADLVITMREGQQTAQTLGVQLKAAGVNTEALAASTATLRAEVDKSISPVTKFAAAFKAFSGITLDSLRTEVSAVITVVNELTKSGEIQNEVLLARLVEVRDEYKKLGLDAPAAIELAIDAQEKLVKQTRTVEESLENIRGIDLDKAAAEFTQFGFDIANAAQAGKLFGNELSLALDQIEAGAIATFGRVTDEVQEAIDILEKAALATVTVEGAFESLNGITLDRLEREVAIQIKNLETLFFAGKIGSQQLTAAIEALREETRLLGPAAQTAFDPMLDALSRLTPLVQTLEDSLELLGAKTLIQLRQEAKLVGDAFLIAFKTGTLSGQELVRVFESEVFPAFQAAGERIPNSLLLAFEKARSLAGVEASKLGDQIGTVLGESLGSSLSKAVENSVGQVVNTIKDRFAQLIPNVSDLFDQIAPGTAGPTGVIKFGTELVELQKNEQQILQKLAGTSGAGPGVASSRAALNEALSIVRGRINEIEEANREAEKASNSFTSSSTSGLNSVASQTNNVAQSFNSLSNSIASAGENLNSLVETQASFGSEIEFKPFGTNIGTPDSSSLVVGTGTPTATSTVSGPATGGAILGSPFGRFQSGVQFAQQGQRAILERGEMIVPRDIARRLRSLDNSQLTSLSPGGFIGAAVRGGANFSAGPNQFVPGTGFVGSVIIGRRQPGSSLATAGFNFVPGFGNVPNLSLAIATGNVDQLGGENTQIAMQRRIIPLVRGAITRRDLTRDISGATNLTNKGQPSTGGS